MTAPKGGYAKDWSRISKKYREKRGWTCEKCGVNLNEHHGLLHCHHRDGVISDNSDANLEALCLLCHSEQPCHGYLKPRLADRILIERLRLERTSQQGRE